MNTEDPSDMDDRLVANHQRQLAIEASEWLARGELTDAAERQKFSQWLSQSPEHVREFLATKSWHDALSEDLAEWSTDVDQLLSGSTNVIDVTNRVPAARARLPIPRSRRSAFIAAVAAVVALIVMPIAQQFWRSNVYETELGEQRSIALSDGSVVSMNTQSVIRVQFSTNERNLYLAAGQATFDVAHDAARPFRVHVNGGVVEAIGTKFDIRRLADRASVAVLEGRVQITSRHTSLRSDSLYDLSERTRLAAGEAVSILDRGDLTPPAHIDVSEVSAWQQRRVVFVDDTLRDIVEEFHRYTPTRIRIEGEALAAARYSGVWDADRPDKLLTYLSAFGNVRVDRDGEEFVIRAIGSVPLSD